MKRFLSIVLIALFLLPAVFANGQKDAASGADEITEVKLWARVGHARDFEIAQIDTFNEGRGKELGVKLVPEFFGGDYDDVLSVARESGKLPDLFATRNQMPSWVEAGMVQPLEGTAAGDDIIADYENYLVEGLHIFNGKVYSVPVVANTFRMVVNMDLLKASGFDAPPASWDEARAIAKKVTEDNDNKKFGFAFPLKWGANGEHFWKLDAIYGMANEYGFEAWFNRDTGKYDFAALAPVLELMRDLKADKSFLPGAEGLDNDTARAEFAAGNLAFMFAASWDYGVYTQQFPIGDKFEWSVIEFPGSGKYSTPLSAGFRLVDGMNAKSKVDKEVLASIMREFIYNEEILADAYSQGLYLPVLPAITASAKGSLAPQWVGLAPTLNDSPETPRPDSKITIDGKTWAEVFMTIWSDPSADIDEAMEDLDVRYNKGLDQAISDGLVDMAMYKN